jgi:hypothetical protein
MGVGNWEGFVERECGEHHSTGGRAWCPDCTEWCYPSAGCKGCEIPRLRGLLAEGARLIGATVNVNDAGGSTLHDWAERAVEGSER